MPQEPQLRGVRRWLVGERTAPGRRDAGLESGRECEMIRIAGFAKVRNECLRGNLFRMLDNLARVADCGVLCDDSSSDGSTRVLADFVMSQPPHAWTLLKLEPHEHDFEKELFIKQ